MYRTVNTILARYGGENTLPPVLTNIKIDGISDSPLILFCIMNKNKKIDRCVFASKQRHTIIGTSPVEPMLGPGGVEGWNYPESAFRALDTVWVRFNDNRSQDEFAETATMYTEYIIDTGCYTAGILAQLFLPGLADTAALAEFCGMTEDNLINTAAGMRERILKNLKVSLEQPSPNGVERVQMQPPRQPKPVSELIDPEVLVKMGLVPEREAEKLKEAKSEPVQAVKEQNPVQAAKPVPPERKQAMDNNSWKMPEGLPDVSELADVKAYIMALKKYGTDAVCRFVRFTETDFAKDCASAFALMIENTVKLPEGAKVYITATRNEITDDGMSIYVVGDYVKYNTQDFCAAKLKRARKYPEHFKALKLNVDPYKFEDMVRKTGADISKIPPAYFAQQTLLAHCRNYGDNDDGILHQDDLSWLNRSQPAPQQQQNPPAKQTQPQKTVQDMQRKPIQPQSVQPQPRPAAQESVAKPVVQQAPRREQPAVKPAAQPVQRPQAVRQPMQEPAARPAPAPEPPKPAKKHTDFYYDNLDVIKANSELADAALKELGHTIALIEETENPQLEPLVTKYRGYIADRTVTQSYVNDFLAVSSNHRSKAYASVYKAATAAIEFNKRHKPLEYRMSCLGCGNEYTADISTVSAEDPVVRCTCPSCGKQEKFSI